MDDSGTKATGKYQGNVTFSADNPLGLSDLFYVNYGRSIGNVPDETDSSGSLKRWYTQLCAALLCAVWQMDMGIQSQRLPLSSSRSRIKCSV
ncbi:hypothetical protein NEILACOT_05669 [Neisseria lactamica ATCC 23970]|uniref:Haemolysin activator HlyB C-terminal domain-containing protein n=1 Tax=Neisseria lactamica ATCC 23970 TaxID=546265 RepID=D0WDN2_NEILA|nr:hypothetical protein NEILACOT_05669 [Neisseria lactamica ATCC 23970]